MIVRYRVNSTTTLETSADLVRIPREGAIATAPGARIVTDARWERRTILTVGDVQVTLTRDEWTWIVHLAAMRVGDDQRKAT